ncbi:laccase-1 isoform X2 [Fopius arisanus]|uniref:Laccase-1 isoform X2 n=1 Tax=Fopius arisanus TaxID=64838 RepID=A0A9R1TDF0_9HYME|nr:PREDICTED: laccase-1-like isoform X2 [Fopius arisanus]
MFFRIAIFIGLGSVVATIIYLTPIPEQTFLSCDRPCHHLDWPMICRVKLTLEPFHSLSKACGNCLVNETSCLSKHCVSVDGYQRGILTANRQLPGPSIQVCENDILVVDIVNRLPGRASAIHWRGQNQVETPSMDGVPLVTQCPISSYTTFQYKFRASVPGTHLWHSHSASDMANGIFGSLIVRQADVREPHRNLYDIDDPSHVILISQWHHSPRDDFTADVNGVIKKSELLLINGKGRQPHDYKMPLSIFHVTPGKRHRFRVAHSGGAGTCPVTFHIHQHSMLLIALDGHPVEPLRVQKLALANGERADFILETTRRNDQYNITVQTIKSCGPSTVGGSAILKYHALDQLVSRNEPIITKTVNKKSTKMTTNPADECQTSGNICVTDIKALKSLPIYLRKPRAQFTIYLSINQQTVVSNIAGDVKRLSMNNASFIYPSSPLLTQGADVPEDILCSGSDPNLSNHCNKQNNGVSECECVHLKRIPLGATVEIIILDQAGRNDLVYHLHGYHFYIVGGRHFGKSETLESIKEMDERDTLFSRNLECPPLKDTVIVPKYGAVAIRFKADNPGYWMLRDEHASEWTRGLDMILQVGDTSEMVPPPQDFPKCGSFIGPDYFLI